MFVEPLSIALYDNEEYNVNTTIKNMRFNGFFYVCRYVETSLKKDDP